MWVMKTRAEMNVLAIAIPDRHHGSSHHRQFGNPESAFQLAFTENEEMNNDTKHKKAWKKSEPP
jgi:hypothetical protein